jgi:chromosome partitioning protein
MTKIYTIANQKGGVGKTTSVINLGAYIGYFGQRVLIIDLDPQANATSCLGVEKKNVKIGTYEVLIGAAPIAPQILHNPKLKISLLPSSAALAGAEVELIPMLGREMKLREAISPIIDRYDYILIDCPPSLSILTINGLVAAKDGILIPVQCEYLALEGLGQLTMTINRVKNSLFKDLAIRGIILTMYLGRTQLGKDVVEEVYKYFPKLVFKTIVPRSVRLAEAPSHGLPISYFASNSLGAIAYEALARELLEQDGIRVPSTSS